MFLAFALLGWASDTMEDIFSESRLSNTEERQKWILTTQSEAGWVIDWDNKYNIGVKKFLAFFR